MLNINIDIKYEEKKIYIYIDKKNATKIKNTIKLKTKNKGTKKRM